MLSYYSKTTTLPSPFKLPIIGNFHQLGYAPHRSLKAIADKYGALMLIHLGTIPVVVASSSKAPCEIMKTQDLVFSNRPRMRIPGIVTYGGKAVGYAPYGEYWRQSKSIYVLHLLSPRRIQMYRKVREKETKLMLDEIRNASGSVIDLSKILMSLTSSVICRIAFARKYGEERFIGQMSELMEMLGVFSFGNYVPSLSWVDRLTGLEGKARKLAKQLDVSLESVIREHEEVNKKMAACDQSVAAEDVVDILLNIQSEQATTNFIYHRDIIKVLILELFSAGTDTTFTNLEWGITELIRHPRVMRKLQQELREIGQGKAIITEEDLENKQHPYLKAVLKEIMRLHIPLPLLVPRESTQDVKVMGYDIPAGTQVIVNAWAIARDPNVWKEAEEFKPEKFLNNDIDYRGLNFEFLPFGAGRRGCPGMEFGMAVNKLALANLAYNFNFNLPNKGMPEELDMSECSGLTIHRKNPLCVIATPCF